MIKKINDFLARPRMTIVAGIFLLFDLVPHLSDTFGWNTGLSVPLPFNPAWIAILISDIPLFHLAFWRVVYNSGIRKISSALLICIAMLAAIAIGDLFAVGEVVFIMAIGALLEKATTKHAQKRLKNLVSLSPTQGRRPKNGWIEQIPAEQIRVNDTLRILPGEAIPVDGIIIRGETSVDQSIMTGESLPVDKAVGDSVFCGTINCFGSIDITATKVGENSSRQTLIHRVEETKNKRALIQRIADRFASWLVPIALLSLWRPFFRTGNIITAVTVLVVFCPCALVLASPPHRNHGGSGTGNQTRYHHQIR